MTTSASPSAVTEASASASAEPPVTYASTVPLENAEDLAHAAGGAHGDTHASTEHAQGGLPQFDTAQWPGQILWLLIIFAVFYVLMATVFAPRIRKVISTRGSTIAENLADARANRDEAEAQAKEAQAEIAEAHKLARKTAADAVARIQADITARQSAEDERLNELTTAAEASIREKRDAAMAHVTDIAVDTAKAIVEKLSGTAATAAAFKSAQAKLS